MSLTDDAITRLLGRSSETQCSQQSYEDEEIGLPGWCEHALSVGVEIRAEGGWVLVSRCDQGERAVRVI